MTTNIKPLEFSIEDLLIEGGLLGDGATFLDHRGRSQPAPVVQLFEFDESYNEDDRTGLAPSDRCLVIRNSGSGGGNFLVREPSMSIMVFSKTRKGDMGVAKQYIELIKQHLSTNYTKDCIISVNIIGDTAGPYNLQSGRRYFELNLRVITGTGIFN